MHLKLRGYSRRLLQSVEDALGDFSNLAEAVNFLDDAAFAVDCDQRCGLFFVDLQAVTNDLFVVIGTTLLCCAVEQTLNEFVVVCNQQENSIDLLTLGFEDGV